MYERRKEEGKSRQEMKDGGSNLKGEKCEQTK